MKLLNKRIPRNKEIQLTILLLIGPLLVLILFFAGIKIYKNQPETKPVVEISDEEYINPFLNLEIEAKAAIVEDLNTGKILYQKNSDEKLPLASITKLMTALVAKEQVKASEVMLLPNHLSTDGEYGLYAGERFSTEKLIDMMLVASANDAASALAFTGSYEINTRQGSYIYPENKSLFIQKMNSKSTEIGLSNTTFLNESGLDQNYQTAGAYGTAEDIAKFMKYLVINHEDLIDITRERYFSASSIQGINHNLENTNDIVNSLPNIIGSKTGYTDLAGGNLVVAVNAGLNNPIVIVVLGSSKEGRFEDVQKLAEAALQNVNPADLNAFKIKEE